MGESIETPLLRVPFESLRRTTRDRKYLLDELQSVLVSLKPAAETPQCASDPSVTIPSVLARLEGLKRKLNETAEVEELEARRCKVRLQHLMAIGQPQKNSALGWNQARMDRILADHMLRCGFLDSASQLAASANIEDLVDSHIFIQARSILEGLAQHDCSAALAWCEENRTRLKRLKSKLEFKLRVQEFVELVRQERMLEAIAYSRKHLAPWAGQYQAELQRALTALAFKAGTTCAPYAALFAESAWDACSDLFCKDLYRLHSMPPESQLKVHLQAGLSALKTPQSYAANSNKEDPLSMEKFQKLAEALPWSKHVHSKLVCSITREIMNEHNPPMVLPNGAVYSERAVQQVASKNHNIFTCPKTGVSCDISDLRRAYIS
ncbi:g2505 [Coccomyxa elongata]